MRDRVDYLDFYKLVSKNDIFGVSETWLKENDKISLPGYEFFPLNRHTKWDQQGEGLEFSLVIKYENSL